MDNFLIAALILEEVETLVLSIGLLLAGGIVGSLVLSPTFALRRVSYFWWVSGTTLLLTLSQLIWAATPAAADAGLISPLILTGFGSFFLFGITAYYGAAARSNHIKGNRSSAWMAFVPFANLWLLFKSGAVAEAQEIRSRSWAARYILDPILVMGALIVFALGQGLGRALEDVPLINPSDSASLARLIAENQTLEESFARQARLAQAELPQRIDEITVMRQVIAEGRTLRITFLVEAQITGFNPSFRYQLASSACAAERFGTDIARGGSIVYEYVGPDDRIIEAFEITEADCV